jgi:hypothetical protein
MAHHGSLCALLFVFLPNVLAKVPALNGTIPKMKLHLVFQISLGISNRRD